MAIFLNIFLAKANRCIRLFLLITILVDAHFASSQHNDTTKLYAAYRQFLNFELDSCQTILESSPRTPMIFYLDILLTSTRIFIEDDPNEYGSIKNLESQLLERLEESDFSDAYSNFLRSEIKLQWAILKFKNGEELASFWGLKQAYKLAKENLESYPEFLSSYKTMGLLHVIYGILPDKYNWILSIFGLSGDVETGLSELGKVNQSDHFLSIECGMAIALLHTYLLNSPEKGAELMELIYKKRRQQLIDYGYALVLMKNGQSALAYEVVIDAMHRYSQPFCLPQWYYIAAEILLQKGLLDEAIKYYHLFLDNRVGSNLIKDSYFKIGICYLLKDDPKQSNLYLEKSRLSGQARNETDKYAQFAAESDYFPVKELYQLRYATDGGFYNKALEVLEKIDTAKLRIEEKCEFHYRTARLFHKIGNLEKALKAYKKTLELQGSENWYFAPNAALQIGLIFLSKGDEKMAKAYLNLTEDYRKYPYQHSIRQKAKAARKLLD